MCSETFQIVADNSIHSFGPGWDLEYNKVIRHYHGHLSAVFCLSLHPILDILITGGRDSVARVCVASDPSSDGNLTRLNDL